MKNPPWRNARRHVPFCFFCVLDSTVNLLLLATFFAPHQAQAQWAPPAALRDVPVFDDCNKTRHGVGLSIQPTLLYPHGAIFMCPERERAIDARHPGASRFFLAHEYGHLAMKSREEAVADEWAAKELAAVPAQRGTLQAVLWHFVEQGTLFDPLYGSGFDRALRVARAAAMPVSEWPPPLVSYANTQEKAKANGVSLALHMTDGDANGAEMVIFLDKEPIGVLSNLDGSKPLDLPQLAQGHHEIQASQVWLYHVDPSGAKSEIARRLQGECDFESTGKKAVAIDLRYDGDQVSIRAIELR
jgi:hypothetical protein